MTMTRQELRQEYAALLLRAGMTADKVLEMTLQLDGLLDAGNRPLLALPAPAHKGKAATANRVRRPRQGGRAAAGAEPRGPKVSAAAAPAATSGGKLRRWTSAEDDKLLRLAEADTSVKEMAAQLDRSPIACSVRLTGLRKQIGLKTPYRRKKAAATTLAAGDLPIAGQVTGEYRNCLSCGATFLSKGAGRKCPDCRPNGSAYA